MPSTFLAPSSLKRRLLAGLACAVLAVGAAGMARAEAEKNPELAAAKRAYDAASYGEALRLIRPLADGGNLTAEFLMGEMYFFGLGVERNDAMAAKWYARPAKAGNGEAAYRLGYLAATGQGGAYDPGAAARWWMGAAGRGHRASIVALSDFYHEGLYRHPDEILARRWLNRAAMTGDIEAMYKLARRLMTPEKLATDYRRAYAWLYISAARGNPAAKSFLAKNQRFFAPHEVRRGIAWGKAFLQKGTPVPAPPGES
ncbi:MAG: sel1 repeat family protein [Rhodospirillaceae bacterium]|nr:sel1 repeat family protein [Rhodospirillaceae bacterium]